MTNALFNQEYDLLQESKAQTLVTFIKRNSRYNVSAELRARYKVVSD
jgi:hypothetical protein